MAMDLQRVEIKNPTGIMTDPEPSDLPAKVWSFGNNVRFRNGKVMQADGFSAVYDTPPEPLLHIMPFLSLNTPFWVAASATKIRITTGIGGWVDYSRLVGGAYTASNVNNWNGGFLAGVGILNNGSDVPQSLLPAANNFTNLPNWPANYRAKIVRPFKNYLIALNLEVDSVPYPTVVKWSSPADPGEVPFTWNPADPTNDAGENPLADTPGAIVDGKKLRDAFIIYKEDSVYAMRYIGGAFVWQFQQLFDDIGMISTNCAAEFDGKHFVVGRGDVYVHNGVSKASVIDGQMKDFLFNSIRDDNPQNCFVIPDYNNTEMWVCFPQASGNANPGYCDKACIWNWVTNEWTIRDLPNIITAALGVVDPQEPDTWDSDTASWDSDATVWGSQTYNPSKMKMVFGSNVTNRMYVVGEVNSFNGDAFTSYLEKSDIYMDDDLKIKAVTSVTPHMSGGGTAKFWVGHSMLQDSPTTWEGPYLYRVGVDHKIDCRIFGRYVGLRMEMDSTIPWTFNGYTLEFVPTAGKR